MGAPILRFDRYCSSDPHILPLGRRVWLEITRGRVQQRIRPVRGRVFLIGTAADCDLVVGDASFPEAYAYLFVHESSVTVRWLGAGPELVAGGEPVETADLHNGDSLSFGPFEVRVGFEGYDSHGGALQPAQAMEESFSAFASFPENID